MLTSEGAGGGGMGPIIEMALIVAAQVGGTPEPVFVVGGNGNPIGPAGDALYVGRIVMSGVDVLLQPAGPLPYYELTLEQRICIEALVVFGTASSQGGEFFFTGYRILLPIV